MKENFRVLVVDDDRRMVRTICDILRVKGHAATEAYSGEEAVEKIRTDPSDCVLMDIKMPGIGGVEALKLIKGIALDLPVLLMSAYAADELELEARRQGAYAVLAKPLDVQMVISFLSLLRKEQSVLVVDDDPNFCRTLRDILRAGGYRVETETVPDNVLRHFEERYQLVVILDLKIGDTNGIEVMRSIREKYPTKPVLLVTGYREDMADTIAKGLESGAHACLYKPLEAEPLFASLKEINRKKLQNALGQGRR